ncbi:piggyBac transposable element-derived protein 4 [Trichonephila clavipes]|nr:piggyBac transposable element-derived protein 4 [Trichonephila clavipes]
MEVKAKKGDSVKLKPKAVVFSNNSMGGVDRSVKCLSYYPVARNQQRKSYKKIFRHLLNQIVWNSLVIFKKNGGILNHIGFRMNLIERLIEGGSDSSSRNFVSPKISENVVRLIGRHFPSYVESDCSKKKNIAKMCATRGLLTTDHVILNHGQVTWRTPQLAPRSPNYHTTPREDVSALDRFNVHRCPTRRVFSGTGLEPVTKQATFRSIPIPLGYRGHLKI